GDAVPGTGFKVFQAGTVRGFNAGPREASRAVLDELTEIAKRYGAGGLVWAFVQDDGTWRSPIAKFLSDEERAGLERAPEGQRGAGGGGGGRRGPRAARRSPSSSPTRSAPASSARSRPSPATCC